MRQRLDERMEMKQAACSMGWQTQTVDILYILGTGSIENDNLPLRWSLRSIDTYAHNIGRVIISGYIPDWISDEVIQVPCDDTGTGRHWNMLGKIANGIKALGLYHPILVSSDDHYLCRHVDLLMFPRFTRGTCYTYQEYMASNRRPKPPQAYQISIMATRQMLDNARLSNRMVCSHMNNWVDGQHVDEVLALAETGRSLSENYGPEPICCFNAIHEKYNPREQYVSIRDKKVQYAYDVDMKIQTGYLGFSTTPSAEKRGEVIKRMKELFPRKSRFEL